MCFINFKVYIIISCLAVQILATLTFNNVSTVLETCLLDLRLPQILRLKYSLDKIESKEDHREKAMNRYIQTNCDQQSCDNPKAMALIGEERGHSTSYHPWQPEEKPSKLQILFQISITALAFLSFGGYLLCLIVQAIKSKGTTYFHPIATATTTTNNGNVKRIKIYRRTRRSLQYEKGNSTLAMEALLFVNYTHVINNLNSLKRYK